MQGKITNVIYYIWNFISTTFFLDTEAPIVDFCEAPPIFLVQNESDLKRKQALVNWNPPIFHDNSLKDISNLTMTIGNNLTSTKISTTSINANVDSGHMFPIGKTTRVVYEARDQSGNAAKCQMDIILQGTKWMDYVLMHTSHLNFPTIFECLDFSTPLFTSTGSHKWPQKLHRIQRCSVL